VALIQINASDPRGTLSRRSRVGASRARNAAPPAAWTQSTGERNHAVASSRDPRPGAGMSGLSAMAPIADAATAQALLDRFEHTARR
jgi:hypothetical protein